VPTPPILDDPRAIERVTRDVLCELFDLTVRNFHQLVERGVLPAPVERGVYSLPDAFDAWLVHKAKLPVPTTELEADIAAELAERARRVYLRRARERASQRRRRGEDVGR